jgi:hypothetical protein
MDWQIENQTDTRHRKIDRQTDKKDSWLDGLIDRKSNREEKDGPTEECMDHRQTDRGFKM